MSRRPRSSVAIEKTTAHSIEQESNSHDCETRAQAQSHFHAGQTARHLSAKATCPDQARQNDHGQGKKNALVEADQERLLGERNFQSSRARNEGAAPLSRPLSA